jgi:hypothetical protein
MGFVEIILLLRRFQQQAVDADQRRAVIRKLGAADRT